MLKRLLIASVLAPVLLLPLACVVRAQSGGDRAKLVGKFQDKPLPEQATSKQSSSGRASSGQASSGRASSGQASSGIEGADTVLAQLLNGTVASDSALGAVSLGELLGCNGVGRATEARFFFASNETLYPHHPHGALGMDRDLYDYETAHSRSGAASRSQSWWGMRPAHAVPYTTSGEYLLQTQILPPGATDDLVLANLCNYYDCFTSDDERTLGDGQHPGWDLSRVLPNTSRDDRELNCDLIYRIEPDILMSATAASKIYQVELILYSSRYDKTSRHYRMRADTVAIGLSANGQIQRADDHINVLRFPKHSPTVRPLAAFMARSYYSVHHTFALVAPAGARSANDRPGVCSWDWDPSDPKDGMWKYVRLECRLRAYGFGTSHHSEPIYLRGLRVRSGFAERLLTHAMDPSLRSYFTSAKSKLQYAAASNPVIDIPAGDAVKLESFRTFAYVDAICYHATGWHLRPTIGSSAEALCHWRAVYEDEIGERPAEHDPAAPAQPKASDDTGIGVAHSGPQ